MKHLFALPLFALGLSACSSTEAQPGAAVCTQAAQFHCEREGSSFCEEYFRVEAASTMRSSCESAGGSMKPEPCSMNFCCYRESGSGGVPESVCQRVESGDLAPKRAESAPGGGVACER